MIRNARGLAIAVWILSSCSPGNNGSATIHLSFARVAVRTGYSAVAFKIEKAALFYGPGPSRSGEGGSCDLRGAAPAQFAASEGQFDRLNTGLVSISLLSSAPAP